MAPAPGRDEPSILMPSVSTVGDLPICASCGPNSPVLAKAQESADSVFPSKQYSTTSSGYPQGQPQPRVDGLDVVHARSLDPRGADSTSRPRASGPRRGHPANKRSIIG
jgi:hypothetical protein